jgi:hypothetical protein
MRQAQSAWFSAAAKAAAPKPKRKARKTKR